MSYGSAKVSACLKAGYRPVASAKVYNRASLVRYPAAEVRPSCRPYCRNRESTQNGLSLKGLKPNRPADPLQAAVRADAAKAHFVRTAALAFRFRVDFVCKRGEWQQGAQRSEY